jgi:hypothetical protein
MAMRRVALFVLAGLLLSTGSLACRDVYVDDGPHGTYYRERHVVHHRPHSTHRRTYHHRHHRYSSNRYHGRPYGHGHARGHYKDGTKFQARTDGESLEFRVKVDD